jgi:hypothetical protein
MANAARGLHWILLWALTVTLARAQSPAMGEVRGIVVDARGGEALANVEVLLVGGAYRTTSDASGHFRLTAVAPGDYVLNVSTVGYHLIKRPFHLDADEVKEFEVILSADTLRLAETVIAKVGPFEPLRQDSPSTLVLAGNDAKNLASVLADDPLRAVQDLPGVSSNNDFDARFSLRGADYSHIGLYLDGILLHVPFHTLEGQNITGSGTAFNGDMVEELELHEGAFPVRFDDRTAAALDVYTRDGSRTTNTIRAFASASNAGAIAEGPLGKSKRGSWVVGARKSYLQYILERTFPDTSLIFGLEDVQGRFTYDLTPKNNITFYALESYSSLDRSSIRQKLGINSLMEASYHYTLGNLSWRYTPTNKLLVVNHAAWMRERFHNSNPTNLPLGGGYYGEWIWNGSATWMWHANSQLDVGWSVRKIRDEGYLNQYQSGGSQLRLLDRYRGTAIRLGGYAQQSWTGWAGRVHLTAGARWDHESIDGINAISPQASVALAVTRTMRIQLGWGQYVQYPELSVLTSILGNHSLLPERSSHVIAAFEQQLGQRTRFRVECYNRADRDLIFQPLFDPRIVNGKTFAPPLNPPYVNSMRGYARGVELFLQRSSANRFTGWISYAYGRTGMREGVTRQAFPSDYDQRHTVNVYGGYRLRPSVNLSLRLSYGSGFPMPGYLRQAGTAYYLTSSRNQLRQAPYARADFRINKAWTHDKWKLTLYGEVVNLTNRANYAFDILDGYNAKTGQAFITVNKLFPIIPSAGLVFER